MIRLVLVLVTAATLAAGFTQQTTERIAAPGAPGWLVEGATRAEDVKLEPFLGRPSLWLRNGTHAISATAKLIDGTIEFDLAPMDAGDFVAIVFRRTSLASHENIYLRPRTSGRFMAAQYAPRINGSSTWQLYPEFAARTDWPRNAWTHVRVVVSGSRLEVFVGSGSAPIIAVPRLRHSSTESSDVAFWSRVNDRPAEWAAALSNIQIRPAPAVAPRVATPPSPAGFVADWRVAGPMPAPDDAITSVPADLEWSNIGVEESGLVNLNMRFPARGGAGRFTAFLRTTITADDAVRRLAGIGYSDDVTVFVNGAPISSGVNGWNTRIPELQSFVDPRFERVWLPLVRGPNDIVLAVTDDQRFGWGAAMTLAEPPARR